MKGNVNTRILYSSHADSLILAEVRGEAPEASGQNDPAAGRALSGDASHVPRCQLLQGETNPFIDELGFTSRARADCLTARHDRIWVIRMEIPLLVSDASFCNVRRGKKSGFARSWFIFGPTSCPQLSGDPAALP